MAGFNLFRFFSKEESSKNIARERLKLCVLYDRAGLSKATLDQISKELNQCLSRFLVVDEPGLDVQLTSAERGVRTASGSQLMICVPIKQLLLE